MSEWSRLAKSSYRSCPIQRKKRSWAQTHSASTDCQHVTRIEPMSNPSERLVLSCWTFGFNGSFSIPKRSGGADADRPDNGSIFDIAAREPAVSLPTPQRTLLLTRWQGALLSLSPQNAYLAFSGRQRQSRERQQ